MAQSSLHVPAGSEGQAIPREWRSDHTVERTRRALADRQGPAGADAALATLSVVGFALTARGRPLGCVQVDMAQRPALRRLHTCAKKLADHVLFDAGIMIAILCATVLVGVQTYEDLPPFWGVLEGAILAIFVAEVRGTARGSCHCAGQMCVKLLTRGARQQKHCIVQTTCGWRCRGDGASAAQCQWQGSLAFLSQVLVKLLAEGLLLYFMSAWNLFDFSIVVSCALMFKMRSLSARRLVLPTSPWPAAHATRGRRWWAVYRQPMTPSSSYAWSGQASLPPHRARTWSRAAQACEEADHGHAKQTLRGVAASGRCGCCVWPSS